MARRSGKGKPKLQSHDAKRLTSLRKSVRENAAPARLDRAQVRAGEEAVRQAEHATVSVVETISALDSKLNRALEIRDALARADEGRYLEAADLESILALDDDARHRWLAAQLQEIEDKLNIAHADAPKLAAEYAQEMALAADWEHKAKRAVLAGDDGLAKRALARKAEHKRAARKFQHGFMAEEAAAKLFTEVLANLKEQLVPRTPS